MSQNKRYYWLKLKKDFFESKMIKVFKTLKNGNEMIIAFLKIQLHSLENDGYIYFENMMPTFYEELAVAIDENAELTEQILNLLIRFKAIEQIDENTYYLSIIEDCIGSETKAASRKRDERSRARDGQCRTESGQCHTEKEIEKEIDIESEKKREEKKTSAFSVEKKSGSLNADNKISEKKQPSPQHNSAGRLNVPRNYEMEEYLRKMGKDPMSFYK